MRQIKQILLKRNALQLGIWFALSVGLVSCTGCATGPRVTYCIISSETSTAECANDKESFSWPLINIDGFKCFDPGDIERMLKACKQGQVIEVTTCTMDARDLVLRCVQVDGLRFTVNVREADGYSCLSARDVSRIRDRCD